MNKSQVMNLVLVVVVIDRFHCNIVEVSIMSQLGLSQSWLYALYDTLSICDGE